MNTHDPDAPLYPLSDDIIVQLVREGKTQEFIARRWNTSQPTVSRRIAKLYGEGRLERSHVLAADEATLHLADPAQAAAEAEKLFDPATLLKEQYLRCLSTFHTAQSDSAKLRALALIHRILMLAVKLNLSPATREPSNEYTSSTDHSEHSIVGSSFPPREGGREDRPDPLNEYSSQNRNELADPLPPDLATNVATESAQEAIRGASPFSPELTPGPETGHPESIPMDFPVLPSRQFQLADEMNEPAGAVVPDEHAESIPMDFPTLPSRDFQSADTDALNDPAATPDPNEHGIVGSPFPLREGGRGDSSGSGFTSNPDAPDYDKATDPMYNNIYADHRHPAVPYGALMTRCGYYDPLPGRLDWNGYPRSGKWHNFQDLPDKSPFGRPLEPVADSGDFAIRVSVNGATEAQRQYLYNPPPELGAGGPSAGTGRDRSAQSREEDRYLAERAQTAQAIMSSLYRDTRPPWHKPRI